MHSDTLIEALNWRYAVKEFDPERKIPADTIATLVQTLTLTPSSFGLQPWKFLIISQQEILDQLPSISYEQPQARDCSHMVVFAIKADYSVADVAHYVERMAHIHETTTAAHQGFSEYAGGFIQKAAHGGWVDEWSTQQAYIALGQFMTIAALLEIDTCPMGGIDPKAYDELLGLTSKGLKTVVVCPIGYRSSTDKYASLKKVRFDSSEMIEQID